MFLKPKKRATKRIRLKAWSRIVKVVNFSLLFHRTFKSTQTNLFYFTDNGKEVSRINYTRNYKTDFLAYFLYKSLENLKKTSPVPKKEILYWKILEDN